MKKHIFLAIAAILFSTALFAQVATTPEVPRNYKPKPKELLPMPGELTTEMIFPVLGKYMVLNNYGDSSEVFISLDSKSKGVVWVSGLSEGKFKAELKASPATYKIPAQKTYFNDAPPAETMSDDAASSAAVDDAAAKAAAKRFSGKSVNEGTMIYDKDANTIYINFGSKFNETDPHAVFQDASISSTDEDSSVKNNKSKKNTSRGKNYTGAKVIEANAAIVP